MSLVLADGLILILFSVVIEVVVNPYFLELSLEIYLQSYFVAITNFKPLRFPQLKEGTILQWSCP